MMKTKSFIAIALFSACMTSFATGNSEAMPEMATMMASKKVKPVTVERNCSTFTAIENNTPCNVFYKQGETYRVSIVAPPDQAEKINTSVVDGVLKNVEVEYTYKTEDGKQVIDTVTISSITGSDEGLSGLEIENTLRGYINLNKVVVDEHHDVVESDNTKFEYSNAKVEVGKDTVVTVDVTNTGNVACDARGAGGAQGNAA